MTAQRQTVNEPPSLFAALDYAAIGWHIFPCHTGDPASPTGCDCRKAECTDPGKHPRNQNGLTGATAAEPQIRHWWGRLWPQANVAVRTGAESDIVVIDVDGEDGWRTVHELEARLGPLPRTVMARTGGGGNHLVFTHPGRRVKTRAKIGHKLDVRGDGGYALVEPSRHASGNIYRWEAGQGPHDIPPAALPPAWVDFLCPPERGRPQEASRPPGSRPLGESDLAGAVDLLWPSYAEGVRHDLTLHLSGWLARQGYAETDAARLIDRLAADDPERPNRLRNVTTSYDHAAAGSPVAGWSRLREILPPGDLLALERLLGRPAPRLVIGRNGSNPEADEATDEEPGGASGAKADDSGKTPPPRRPEIDAGDQDLERVSALAWKAIEQANNPAQFFVFAGAPSRIVKATDDSGPVIQRLDEDRLGNELTSVAQFYKVTAQGDYRDAEPRVRILRNMLANRTFPLPTLVGVVEVPTFAPDGSLPAGPGYHPPSRTYYEPAPGFVVPPIPEDPSDAQIAAARSLIMDEVLVDFPFTGDAERANAMALLLLPLVRGLIPGPTPLHLIEKPTAGTGASLLADVVTRIATGRPIGAMTEGRDEDEWRKRLTAKLRGTPPLVLIDNIRRRLDSGVVSAILTASHVEDRILGTSDNVRFPVRCVWVATGNNPSLSSEITRRTMRIRLDAKRDRPWLRADFKHDPLLPWVLANRAEIVAACLTLGRAWIAAGRPVPAEQRTLGSFEDWSRVMAGILDVANIPGFLTNLSEFYEASDTEGADIRAFLSAWWAKHAGSTVGVTDLFSIATSDDGGLDLGDKGERSQKIRLGRKLGELRDRHYQLSCSLTVRVTPAGTEKKIQLWRLVGTETGVCGVCGVCVSPNPTREEPRPHPENVSPTERDTYTTYTTYTEAGGAPSGRVSVHCGDPLPEDISGLYCERHSSYASRSDPEGYDSSSLPWDDLPPVDDDPEDDPWRR
ncbi:MAG: bifunctional DNA primase/polymerase [Chloroflexota bacterium]|nr:bifunctional DNA primase/polymerase [Chloroflexota bacterium]